MSAPSSTFNAFDGDAYEQVMGRWSRRLAVPFADFAGHARNGERVLDVGCGTGHLAGLLASQASASRVVGVDLAEPYLERARREYGALGIDFRAGDACALPFDDASFDRVLALLVLHFVPKSAQAVAQMRRVARPGATVAAATWDVRGGFVANRQFWDTAAALDARAVERRARNYTRPLTRPGELAAAWRAAGFVDVVETSLIMRMEFESFDDYWAPYAGRDGPGAEYVSSLDDAARARLSDALRTAYFDGEPDGPRSYAGLACAVRGTVPAH
jgi:SAM-dependent methyltransferase